MKTFALVSALALAVTAGAAQASTLLFTFSQGSAPGAYNFSFKQDSNPTPLSYRDIGPDGIGGQTEVAIWGLTGNIAAAPSIIWYPSTNGGLFDIGSFGAWGPQAYGNTLAAPSFAPGVFVADTANNGLGGTLTIASAPAAAPEPAVWAMLVAGFGLLGLALRGRRAMAAA